MNIAEILILKFPKVDLVYQVELQDDGEGPYIKKWDSSLGPKPTQAMLDVWAIEVSPLKKAADVLKNRLSEYPSTDELVVALWEKVMGDKPLAAEELEVKRQEIKNKYPKS